MYQYQLCDESAYLLLPYIGLILLCYCVWVKIFSLNNKLDLYSKSVRQWWCWRRRLAARYRQEKKNPLPNCYFLLLSISIGGAAPRASYILQRVLVLDEFFLLCFGKEFRARRPDAHGTLLHQVKTLLVVQRLCVLKFKISHDFLHASFPLTLSLPSLLKLETSHACMLVDFLYETSK